MSSDNTMSLKYLKPDNENMSIGPQLTQHNSQSWYHERLLECLRNIFKSDTAACYPLKVEIYKPAPETLSGWQSPALNGYSGSHGKE